MNEIFDVGGDGAGAGKREDDEGSAGCEGAAGGGHLYGESILGIKKLLRGPDRQLDDAQSVQEIPAGVECLAGGIPQKEFSEDCEGV